MSGYRAEAKSKHPAPERARYVDISETAMAIKSSNIHLFCLS
jgi:hypothetical protein